MAIPENVLQDISLGVLDDERPSDAIYMCVSVGTMLASFDKDYSYEDIGPAWDTFPYWSKMDRLIFGVGKILCPIFDPLKLDQLADYSREMTEVRISYRGIATNLELRQAFDERAFLAVKKGSFASLKRAAADNLPRQIGRPELNAEVLY